MRSDIRSGFVALLLAALLGCAPASQHPAKVSLDVPHLSQETLLCVPTSAAMVLAFYGDPQSPRKLKALSLGKTYLPGQPFTDFSITPFAALIEGLGKLGYRWEQVTFPQTPQGFEDGLAQIEASLAAGQPALVDISVNGVGHTLVVSGYDRRRRTLSFVDPNAPAPGQSSARYDQFEAVWNERAYGGAFRAMIRTARK